MEDLNGRYRQSLLYDFYGELLNEHQKEVYSAAVFDDMSYTELAEEFNVSRQAAFDLVKRIQKKLEGYESRLGLVGRFVSARERADSLRERIDLLKQEIDESVSGDKVKNNLKEKIDNIADLSEEVFDFF